MSTLTVVRVRPAQRNRQLLCQCYTPGCSAAGYRVRTTRVWLSRFGPPGCPSCGAQMLESGVRTVTTDEEEKKYVRIVD
jgi:hypothetical protein